jgi:hypothetical protein
VAQAVVTVPGDSSLETGTGRPVTRRVLLVVAVRDGRRLPQVQAVRTRLR